MPTPSGQKMIVIGYGNDLRSDDGAGVRVAAKLAGQLPESRVIVTQQLTPDLADEVGAAEQVVFVDAYAADAVGAELRIERISGTGAGGAHAIGHRGDPASLVRLAGQLFGKVPEAWVIGIPAFCFEAGEAISPGTSHRIDEAVALIGERTFSEHWKGERP